MTIVHDLKIKQIQRQLVEGFMAGKQVRLKRASTNSTRKRDEPNKEFLLLDISDLNEALEINAAGRYADIEPGIPMDRLVAATLRENLIPPVVPEFPGITAGGAVQGGALESSSFKFGQF